MLLLSPLLEFKRNNKTRKNMLISNVGKGSKDARFKLGIETKDLTRNDEVIEETKQDGLMLRKVTYKWYNILLETMKDTVQHFRIYNLCQRY